MMVKVRFHLGPGAKRVHDARARSLAVEILAEVIIMNSFPRNGFLQILGFESLVVGTPIYTVVNWNKNRRRSLIGGAIFFVLGLILMSV